MKKIFYTYLILSVIQISAAEQKIASTPKPVEKPLVIKVIDEGKIFMQAKEGKDAEQKLTNLRKSLETDILKLQKSIEDDLKTLQSKAQIIDPATLENEQEKIMRKKKEHEMKVNQAQEDFQRSLQREYGKLSKELKDIVTELAKKNGWDLVMSESGVLYKSDRINAEDEIAKALNTKYDEKKKVEAKKTESLTKSKPEDKK